MLLPSLVTKGRNWGFELARGHKLLSDKGMIWIQSGFRVQDLILQLSPKNKYRKTSGWLFTWSPQFPLSLNCMEDWSCPATAPIGIQLICDWPIHNRRQWPFPRVRFRLCVQVPSLLLPSVMILGKSCILFELSFLIYNMGLLWPQNSSED